MQNQIANFPKIKKPPLCDLCPYVVQKKELLHYTFKIKKLPLCDLCFYVVQKKKIATLNPFSDYNKPKPSLSYHTQFPHSTIQKSPSFYKVVPKKVTHQ